MVANANTSNLTLKRPNRKTRRMLEKRNKKEKKPSFQLVTRSEMELMNRIGTYIMNHPKCVTKDIVDYFAEFKEEVVRECLSKLIRSGHAKFIKL